MNTIQRKHASATIALATCLFLAAGCGRKAPEAAREGTSAADGQSAAATTSSAAAATLAVAELEPTQGNKARGTVRFVRENNGIRVTADISGLPVGEHGFHIHETGDCSAPDAESAGGHFNPTNESHGGRDDKQRHAGDFGNITANDKGEAHVEFVDERLSLTGPNSILNRAVIVHAGRDDLTSQPSGNSGARIACGVIRSKE